MNNSEASELLCCPGVDRISQLPDGIIDNILIRLPIADAARTSVLSRKWKHGWLSISKLKFDDEFVSRLKVDRQKLITIIYGILMLHLEPIIGLELTILLPEKTTTDIDRVFHFLSRKGVQELDVHTFQEGHADSAYVLPSHIYSCLQLRRLKITDCIINPPCNFGGFRNLNSLELKELKLTNSMFENFISKCPLLEELSICLCKFIQSSVIKINASNLKRVSIIWVWACFCFTSGNRCFDFEGAEKSSVDDFCVAMPALESLVVDYCLLQSLGVRDMSSKCGRHPKWLYSLKSLEAYGVCLWNVDEVASLLALIGSAPNLKKLIIWVTPLYDVDEMENPFRSLEANHLDFSPCKKLEVVSLHSIVDRDSGMDLVKLLLLKSPNLKKMYIKTHLNTTSDERLKILTKLIRFQRASAAGEIDFC